PCSVVVSITTRVTSTVWGFAPHPAAARANRDRRAKRVIRRGAMIMLLCLGPPDTLDSTGNADIIAPERRWVNGSRFFNSGRLWGVYAPAAIDPRLHRLLLALQVEPAVLQPVAIQPAGFSRRLADDQLPGLGHAGQARGDVDVIAQN